MMNDEERELQGLTYVFGSHAYAKWFFLPLLCCLSGSMFSS